MKPAAFDYVRPATTADAIRLLGETPGAKVLAGGQTLGPMLNLRLAQPALLVDITRIPELAAVEHSADTITLGAAITHAAIEDGRALASAALPAAGRTPGPTPDPTAAFMARVAHGIAYRAVRTRGTIGGSLAHADPAADWLSTLTALGADVLITGPAGRRSLAVHRFVHGAMASALGAAEIVAGIRIPRLSGEARCGFHKICRKTGEFAEAIGVAVYDPAHGVARLVASTPAGAPLVLDGDAAGAGTQSADHLKQRLADAGFQGDAYQLAVAAAALARAAAGARPA